MFQPFPPPLFSQRRRPSSRRPSRLDPRSPFVDAHHPPPRQPPATGPENSISGYRQSPSTLSTSSSSSSRHRESFEIAFECTTISNGKRRYQSQSALWGPRVCVFTGCLRVRSTKNEPRGFVPEGEEILLVVKRRVYHDRHRFFFLNFDRFKRFRYKIVYKSPFRTVYFQINRIFSKFGDIKELLIDLIVKIPPPFLKL